jgi:hypothetical protein
VSRHLRDEGLWSLHEGGGTRADRTHVEQCSACAARYRQLASDLKVLGQVLREVPPLQAAPRRRRTLQIRWAPAVAVMTATLLLVWRQEWLRTLTLPVSSIEARKNEETVRFLTKEIPLALFSTAELDPGKLPAHATNLAYLQAALDGGWPSEPCEPSRTANCEPDPFSRLLEEYGH